LWSHENDLVRREVTKSLSQIVNLKSIKALIEALTDHKFDIRWLAAEGFISIGHKVFIPLLTELVDHSDSQRLCEASITY
jgi:HEAT repeat protein